MRERERGVCKRLRETGVRDQFQVAPCSGLYYKPMTILNDDSRVVNKLEASLTDDARVVIYDHYMFIVQATGRKLRAPTSCREIK